MLKKSVAFVLIFFLSHVLKGSDHCPIVPLPAKYNRVEGRLHLADITQISINDADLTSVAHYLQKEVLRHTGLTISLSPKFDKKSGIIIELKATSKIPDEAYHLNIFPDKVEITASTTNGAFNGVISLLQLIRVAALNKTPIDCWRIKDVPAMTWRGLMLDESRHFFGSKTVKKLLDWMAFYKLNRFHWHLTDSPGWRIEINAYPKLTAIGGIGNHTSAQAPAAYYTQEEINEIVRYAKERFIDIIPEIDMPGHATAANRAYPEYSGGGSLKHPEFTFNPGKEETYAFLTNILQEIDVLFPSKMIHLGGDEVHFGNKEWQTDLHVQNLMREHSLDNLKAVERYFIERMADSISKLNAKILGWDEIATTKMAPENTIIFWWRHDHPEALQAALEKQYQVVLCPRIPLYFDFLQDSSHVSGRKWKGSFSDLESIYNYTPLKYSLVGKGEGRDLIAGIQANIWTEKIASEPRLEYMLFPRISALAEAAWTRPEGRNYSGFLERMSKHQKLYERADLHYYNVLKPELTPEIIDYIPKSK